MYKKILVPVDGSEGSWNCLAAAKMIAEKFGAKLVVLNVVQRLAGASILAGPIDAASVNEGMQELAEKLMDAAREKVGDVDAEFVLDCGRPSKVIVNTAKDKDCDLIVIGSRGLSGFAEFFLGSVSSEVAQLSTVPVLIVK